MKKLPPIVTALLITTVIGFGILVLGVSAFTNPNSTPLQDSPIDTTALNSNSGDASPAVQIQQLSQQVSDLQSQLDQANFSIQQYQSLLLALQQRGVIMIGNDGRVYLPQNNSTSSH
jgi:TolA-binding protein